MATKYDISDMYVSEMSKLQLLVSLGTGRSPLPGTWTSTSSSTLYTYTSEADLMAQLYVVLSDYIIKASDWNGLTDQIVNKFRKLRMGGIPR